MIEHWEPETPQQPAPANSRAQRAAAYVRRSHMAVMASYFGMIGLFTGKAISNLMRGAPLSVAIFLWLFSVVPLLIFLPGLRRNKIRPHAWLTFVVLLYFVQAVSTAFTSGSLVYGLVFCLLCTALFCALVMHIRVARKYLGLSLLQ